jgi:dTDP-4-amino-4,6-dideoxygalactose transaminase
MKEISIAKPQINWREQLAVIRVLKSGSLAQGPEVKLFEEEFSKIVGDRECVAVNSGTSALHMSLLALGIGSGDEVILPSFTFAATANVVALAGAKPVFVDIDPKTLALYSDSTIKAINSKTKAVFLTHILGLNGLTTELIAYLQQEKIILIEDNIIKYQPAIIPQFMPSFFIHNKTKTPIKTFPDNQTIPPLQYIKIIILEKVLG